MLQKWALTHFNELFCLILEVKSWPYWCHVVFFFQWLPTRPIFCFGGNQENSLLKGQSFIRGRVSSWWQSREVLLRPHILQGDKVILTKELGCPKATMTLNCLLPSLLRASHWQSFPVTAAHCSNWKINGGQFNKLKILLRERNRETERD